MLIPRGYKTREQYLAYVARCERALYGRHEIAGDFDVNAETTRIWSQSYDWSTTGLVRVVYQGVLHKSYSRPIFNIRDDRCGGRADHCYKCLAMEGTDYTWEQDDDSIIPIGWYTGFDDQGERVTRYISYDIGFAAKAGHP